MGSANEERQAAELEFVRSAYDESEAWVDTSHTGDPIIYRRLRLPSHDQEDDVAARIRLAITLPKEYPDTAPLHLAAELDDTPGLNTCSMELRKTALNVLPRFLDHVRQKAGQLIGDEAVFAVISEADEWVQVQWTKILENEALTSATSNQGAPMDVLVSGNKTLVLGRRLIYSHHIISKVKRADIKRLVSDLHLTGYMKIGWPGILIIEGSEQDCICFYDEIRPWSWKYLVVRGEQQVVLQSSKDSQMREVVDRSRRFSQFVEVDNMSVVAQACRDVGLESLFKTALKLYDNDTNESNLGATDEDEWFGVLVLVDHMNDGKGYRKWLQKTGKKTDCLVFTKTSYPNDDFSNRPCILVGIVGKTASSTSHFMKCWRSTKVDVDTRGRACLERKLNVLEEGIIPSPSFSDADGFDSLVGKERVVVTCENMTETLYQVGGRAWALAGTHLLASV